MRVGPPRSWHARDVSRVRVDGRRAARAHTRRALATVITSEKAMASPEQALATQLKNVEAKTGKSTGELFAMIVGCSLAKVAEQRAWLMQTTGLGYGDANTIVLLAKKAQQPST